jgi:hypothetical protein
MAQQQDEEEEAPGDILKETALSTHIETKV